MRNKGVVLAVVVVALAAAVALWSPAGQDTSARADRAGSPTSEYVPLAPAAGARPAPAPTTSAPAELTARAPGLTGGTDGLTPRLLARDGDAGQPLDESRAWLERFLQDNAATARANVDRYCEVTRGLRARPRYQPASRAKDAAVFMDGRADWEGGRTGLLHLPDTVTARLKDPAESWRRAGPELYAGLDFAWLEALRGFDHWSLATQGPLRDQRPTSMFESPLPEYGTLVSWAKLRLLKGAHEGALPVAADEVLHLADLCASGGALLGELLRGSFHALVRRSFEEAGQPVPDGVFTDADRRQVRAAGLAGVRLLYPGVPEDVRSKALGCIPMRCAALNEAIGFSAGLVQLRPASADDVKWLARQQPCDAALAGLLSRTPPIDPESLRDSLPPLGDLDESFSGADAGR
ncbi:MAG: hypothetical protein JNJ54_35740 [Myxococcaceae bacterium]|nr:hypothetical protein [Myxococcaceae bacterium]